MILKPFFLPTLLTVASLTGGWNMPATSAPAPLASSAPAFESVVPLSKSTRPLIEDDERAQLRAAEQEASQLGAMRGGDLSNHELTIGVIILAIIVVLILL
jgi:hypothetical protein